MKSWLTPFCLLISGVMALGAPFVFEPDFTQPNYGGAVVTGTGEGRQIMAVGGTSDPVSPFPTGTGLMLEQDSASSLALTARWNLPEPMTSGTLSFSFYSFADDEWTSPLGIVYLYSGNTIAMRLRWGKDTGMSIGGSLTPGGAYASQTLQADWSLNTLYRVEIVTREDKSFSVYLDGELLTLSGSTQSEFYWRDGITSVNRLTLANPASTSVNSRVFFDEVKLVAPIPEPSTLATLAVGGALLVATRRLRRRGQGV